MKQSKQFTIKKQVIKAIKEMHQDVTFEEIINKINDLQDKLEELDNSDKLSKFFQNSPLAEMEIDLERDKSPIRNNEIL